MAKLKIKQFFCRHKETIWQRVRPAPMYGYRVDYKFCKRCNKHLKTSYTPLARHGKWVDRQLTDNPAVIRYKCNLCHRSIDTVYPIGTKDFPYCHCGAKMDLES